MIFNEAGVLFNHFEVYGSVAGLQNSVWWKTDAADKYAMTIVEDQLLLNECQCWELLVGI